MEDVLFEKIRRIILFTWLNRIFSFTDIVEDLFGLNIQNEQFFLCSNEKEVLVKLSEDHSSLWHSDFF